MKGLLVKDFRLMLHRKRFFLIMAAWAVVMGFVSNGMSFVVGWMCMLMAIFSLSTLSYDEYDNSMPFLMSMPVSGKDYAIGKYLFGFVCGVVGWLFAIITQLIPALIMHKISGMRTELMPSLIFIPLILVVLSVGLPVELKWGSEKGRTYMLLIYGIAFAGVMAAVKLLPGCGKLLESLESVSPAAAIIAVAAGTIVITALSMLLSVRIMEKKEF